MLSPKSFFEFELAAKYWYLAVSRSDLSEWSDLWVQFSLWVTALSVPFLWVDHGRSLASQLIF